MIKADIVKKVAEQLKVKDKEALIIVDSVLEAMKNIVAKNGRLEIRDFGVFQTKKRKERLGRNPKDKKEYPIPPRQVVTFKMGKELKLSGVVADHEEPGDDVDGADAQQESSPDSQY